MRLRLFFLVFLILEIYGSLTYHRPLVFMTKPLLMPMLMIIAYSEGVKDKYYYLALIFSWLGDSFLMFNNYFIPGLIAFLISHIFYILLFRKEYQFYFLAILFFSIATVSYVLLLYPKIPEQLKIPVILYCSVITLMGIYAGSRKANTPSYRFILTGGILFIISDSLIAFNKFYFDIPNDALYVMTTYGAAQYLILEGWLKKDSLLTV